MAAGIAKTACYGLPESLPAAPRSGLAPDILAAHENV